MAKQVKAWKSESGAMFPTEREADQDDVRREFNALYYKTGFPEVSTDDMLEWITRHQVIIGKWLDTLRAYQEESQNG